MLLLHLAGCFCLDELRQPVAYSTSLCHHLCIEELLPECWNRFFLLIIHEHNICLHTACCNMSHIVSKHWTFTKLYALMANTVNDIITSHKLEMVSFSCFMISQHFINCTAYLTMNETRGWLCDVTWKECRSKQSWPISRYSYSLKFMNSLELFISMHISLAFMINYCRNKPTWAKLITIQISYYTPKIHSS